ncbi:MAG: hypothetical protein JXP34_06170 [Planctomycetes bacterium]|nr:hypothetical protein [Planctomycetota bacterium]
MKVLAIVGIFLLAAVGSRWTLLRVKGIRIHLLGPEFVALGLFLGGEAFGQPFLDILGPETRLALSPAIALALGWAGFLFGHHLRGDIIRRFPRAYVTAAACESAGAAAVVFAALGLATRAIELPIAVAIALAGVAAPTSPTALGLLRRSVGSAPSGSRADPDAGRSAFEAMLFAAGTDEVLALPIYAVGWLAISRGSASDAGLAMASAAGLGLLLGGFIHLASRLRVRDEEMRLLILGAVTLGAGAALLLGLPPLFATAAAGILAGNLRGRSARIDAILAGLERPVYTGLLVIAGASLSVDGPAIGIGLALAALRLAGKLAGGAAASAITGGRVPARFGLGLASHGGLALAMLVSLAAAFGDAPRIQTAISAGIIAMAASELIALPLAGLAVRAPEAKPC